MGSNTTDVRMGGGNDKISGDMGFSRSSTGMTVDGPGFKGKSSSGLGWFMNTMGGQVGAQTNKQGTTSMGLMYNLLSGGGSYDSENVSTRFGVGIGGGGGVRIHDGEKQGIGGDFGPVTFDYSSKTFGKTATGIGELMGTGRMDGMSFGNND